MGTLLKQNPEEISYQSGIRECYSINPASPKLLCTAVTVALAPQMQKKKKSTLHKTACVDRKQLPEILSLEVNDPIACCLSKP